MTRIPRRLRTVLVVGGLLFLSLVPVIAGMFRLTDLTVGEPTPETERFFGFGVAIVGHIVGATLYCVLGALQFIPSLRRRAWHRRMGRLLVPAGLIAAGTGIWMAVSPALPATNSAALVAMRIGFGGLMIVALVLGLRAALRRDFTTHRAWMVRAYAIGLGAGTQVFTLGPLPLLLGEVDATATAVGMAAGWIINLAVAELAIRRWGRRPSAPVVAPAPSEAPAFL